MKAGINIIESLREKLKMPLPGEEAHQRMAPSYRPHLTREQIQANHPRVGGVMLLLYEKSGEFYIVFTQRKAYAGVHGGQMSFPGGKKEEDDHNIIETALRETHEEIGVPAKDIEVIGQLSQLYIPPSNFLVYPVVGYTRQLNRFTPEEEEVEKIVEIPVAFFMDNSHINMQTEIKLYTGTVVQVPAYVYGQHIIWGATAIILSEFTEILGRAH